MLCGQIHEHGSTQQLLRHRRGLDRHDAIGEVTAMRILHPGCHVDQIAKLGAQRERAHAADVATWHRLFWKARRAGAVARLARYSRPAAIHMPRARRRTSEPRTLRQATKSVTSGKAKIEIPK
jgi:hypothetical protein